MKKLLFLLTLIISVGLHAQVPWNFDSISLTGIESPLNNASGNYATSMGYTTYANGFAATSTGYFTTAPGSFSVSMGSGTFASGSSSIAMGNYSSAAGDYSTSMGNNTIAVGFGTVAIGHFNSDNSSSGISYFNDNSAFVIGNGTGTEDRSNALTVLFDGTTTIAGDLTVNSDERLKTNIMSLGSTLSLLKMLDGKTYYLKKGDPQQKIGLLAQDVRVVFPELVKESKDDQGTLSVNYQGMIPVLINAINEQQIMIEQYEDKLNKQQAQIDKLLEILEYLGKDKK